MRFSLLILCAVMVLSGIGCETVKKGTTKVGEVAGQGADVIGGVTEGAVDGYAGTDDSGPNPYDR